MTPLLAQADTAFLLSVVKPPIFAVVVGAWAWVVSHLDKDAGFFYLKRGLWGVAHLAAGLLGMALMLFVPVFWIGLPLGLLVMAGSIAGYVLFRNKQVPPGQEWSLDLESFRQNLQDRQQKSAQASAAFRIRRSNGEEVSVPPNNDPRQPVHRMLEDLLAFALPREAESIDLSVEPERTALSVRIDGVKYAREAPDPKTAVQLIDYVKQAAGQDPEERRRRQSGRISAVDDEGAATDLEVVTAGSTRGMKMQLLIDPDRATEIPLSMLGLLPRQLEYVETLLGENQRVVLFAAGKHSGVPTSMYAAMQQVDPYTNSVVAIEANDSVELEGVDRHVIPKNTPPAEFNQKLGVIIRSDPNIVMMDRIADAESLHALANVGAEMRFMAPVPAEDATKALKMYIQAAGDPKQAARSLATVVAQRLVRRLCTTCRVPYRPDPAAIKKLNIPADKISTLYKASGKVLVKDREQECPDCHGLGYRGRVAVFEIMPIDDTARGFIAKGDHDQLRNHLRKQGMIYLQEAALAKVAEGLTDIKEVQRVLSSKES
jgi:type II secretory ATPase GspE/PulE/Tfp pilus assembly ATPase PilB-like protein